MYVTILKIRNSGRMITHPSISINKVTTANNQEHTRHDHKIDQQHLKQQEILNPHKGIYQEVLKWSGYEDMTAIHSYQNPPEDTL